MFTLSIKSLENKRVINFANSSTGFVEVVFAIDGKEVKEGKVLSSDTKGYGYPPKLEKAVKKMKNGSPLDFSPRGGEVVAYVFTGEGRYRDKDIDIPAFVRHKVAESMIFRRTSDEPVEVIKVKY